MFQGDGTPEEEFEWSGGSAESGLPVESIDRVEECIALKRVEV